MSDYVAPLGVSEHEDTDHADPGLVVRVIGADGLPIVVSHERSVTHDVSDWHGEAHLYFRESMPREEQLRRVAKARTIHGEHSMEACCVRKRAARVA